MVLLLLVLVAVVLLLVVLLQERSFQPGFDYNPGIVAPVAVQDCVDSAKIDRKLSVKIWSGSRGSTPASYILFVVSTVPIGWW